MPTESQFTAFGVPFSQTSIYRGDDWKDYILVGDIKTELGPNSSVATPFRVMTQLATVEPSAGYVWAFPPGTSSNQAYPSQAGEWKKGSKYLEIVIIGGNYYYQEFELINIDNEEDFLATAPGWLLQFMYENDVFGTAEHIDNIGFWEPVTEQIAVTASGSEILGSLTFTPTTPDLSGYYTGSVGVQTDDGNGNGKKSLLPWAILGAVIVGALT